MYNYRKIPIKRLKKSEVEFDFQMFGCCKFTLLLDHVVSVYRKYSEFFSSFVEIVLDISYK